MRIVVDDIISDSGDKIGEVVFHTDPWVRITVDVGAAVPVTMGALQFLRFLDNNPDKFSATYGSIPRNLIGKETVPSHPWERIRLALAAAPPGSAEAAIQLKSRIP